MPKDQDGSFPGSTRSKSEQEERAIIRCLNMVDYISDAAANIIINFIDNIPCPEAKRFLLTKPEELALKSFEKAIADIVHGGRRQEEQTH